MSFAGNPRPMRVTKRDPAVDQNRPVTTLARELSRLLTFHAIILRSDDLPRTIAFQPRIGPNTWQTFAPGRDLSLPTDMLAAIDNGNTVSEEAHPGLIKTAVMRSAYVLPVLQFIGFREASTTG